MADEFGARLIAWYNIYKRDLPWRNTKDAYKVWLSEVILQQTRVSQGLNYYHNFVEQYPDIYSLAKASQDDVFKLWQGLGYYNRAANLMEAAKSIVNNYDGIFPETTEELLKIKGIGPYTSAAIASIVYKVSEPVLDGNVFRVLTRIFGISTPIDNSEGKKEIHELSLKLMSNHNPGIYNQALMEYGAIHCTPKKPDCENCIFKTRCFAYKKNAVFSFPVKKSKPVVRNKYFYYFVVEVVDEDGSSFYMKKRAEKDIWKNLYDFPLETFDTYMPVNRILNESNLIKVLTNTGFIIENVSHEYVHKLTHRRIHAKFIRLIVNKKINHPIFNSLTLVLKNNIVEYPVPRLIDRYLREQKIIK